MLADRLGFEWDEEGELELDDVDKHVAIGLAMLNQSAIERTDDDDADEKALAELDAALTAKSAHGPDFRIVKALAWLDG